jgi:hypothetical protein
MRRGIFPTIILAGLVAAMAAPLVAQAPPQAARPSRCQPPTPLRGASWTRAAFSFITRPLDVERRA